MNLDNIPNTTSEKFDVFLREFEWKFNEGKLLDEIRRYIANTYAQHYAGNSKDVQTIELMAKRPERLLWFALMNAMKYEDRYGAKNGYNRDDLLKALHYGFLALYAHDKMEGKLNETK